MYQAKSVSICSEPVTENGPCRKKEDADDGGQEEYNVTDSAEEVHTVAAQLVQDVVRQAAETARERLADEEQQFSPKQQSPEPDASSQAKQEGRCLQRLPTIQIETVPSMPSSPTESWPSPPPEATIPEEDEDEATLDESHIEIGFQDEEADDKQDIHRFAANYVEELLAKAVDVVTEKQRAQDTEQARELAKQVVDDVISRASESAAELSTSGLTLPVREVDQQHLLPTIHIDTVPSMPPSPTTSEEGREPSVEPPGEPAAEQPEEEEVIVQVPVVEEQEPAIEEKQTVAQEPEPTIEEEKVTAQEPVVEEPESTIDETESVTDRVLAVDELSPTVEEKEVSAWEREEPERAIEEPQEVFVEEPVVEEPESVIDETEPVTAEELLPAVEEKEVTARKTVAEEPTIAKEEVTAEKAVAKEPEPTFEKGEVIAQKPETEEPEPTVEELTAQKPVTKEPEPTVEKEDVIAQKPKTEEAVPSVGEEPQGPSVQKEVQPIVEKTAEPAVVEEQKKAPERGVREVSGRKPVANGLVAEKPEKPARKEKLKEIAPITKQPAARDEKQGIPEIICGEYEEKAVKRVKYEDAPKDLQELAQSYVKDIIARAVTVAEEKAAHAVPFNFEDVDLMKASGPWYIRAREAFMRVLRSTCFCTPRRTDS